MNFPWIGSKYRITGCLRAWRAAFPAARAVNESGRVDIIKLDFVHIRGDARAQLYTVNMMQCHRDEDAAFVHLRGIHTLNMSYCNQATITDIACVHLRGILTLNMSHCNQPTITPAAIAHLVGIVSLDSQACRADVIDAATKLLGINKVKNVSNAVG